MEKNPFLVLGINEDLVRKLSDEQLDSIITSQYRTLQKLFHPDVAKSKKATDKKSKEINDAYAKLNRKKNPELYRAYKDRFINLGGINSRLRNLESQLEESRIMLRDSVSQFLEYLKGYSERNRENKLTVFNLAPAELQLHDYGLYLTLSRHDVRAFPTKKDKAKFFYKMQIDANGRIAEKKQGNKKTYHNKNLIGCIDEETAHKNGNILQILRLAQNINYERDNELRLGRGPAGTITPQPISEYQERIPIESFSRILPLLTPEVRLKSYLFSLNTESDNAYFTLDGSILRIERN